MNYDKGKEIENCHETIIGQEIMNGHETKREEWVGSSKSRNTEFPQWSAASLRKNLLLYAVTDRGFAIEQTLFEQIRKALEGGVTFLQLREKELSYEEFLAEAIEVKSLTDHYRIPYVINDNLAVALRCGADGVHIGQSDGNVVEVRKLLGDKRILGVSVSTVSQAMLAQQQGADYLGVGAVFTTSTKLDAEIVSLTTLREICEAVSIPVVAIGGIHGENISELGGTGIDGVALVSAIFGQSDIARATKELRTIVKQILQ